MSPACFPRSWGIFVYVEGKWTGISVYTKEALFNLQIERLTTYYENDAQRIQVESSRVEPDSCSIYSSFKSAVCRFQVLSPTRAYVRFNSESSGTRI
jgi:hypothetical protein